jgi:hypothetical protein
MLPICSIGLSDSYPREVPCRDDDSVRPGGNAAAKLGDHVRADPAGYSFGLYREPHSWQTRLGQEVASRGGCGSFAGALQRGAIMGP